MEMYEQLISRLEVRDFAPDQKISEEVIRKVVEAGRLAPSAMNRQPWKFVIVRDQDQLNRLAELNPHARYVGQAGFAVGIYIKESRFGEIDATRAITHMQLAAWVVTPRLGSCFNFGWDSEHVAKILGPVDGFRLFTIIPFGYPKKSKILGKKTRKSWSEVVVER